MISNLAGSVTDYVTYNLDRLSGLDRYQLSGLGRWITILLYPVVGFIILPWLILLLVRI